MSTILAYMHEYFFPDIYSCIFLVSLTIYELTGGRQNISKVLLCHSNLPTTQIYLPVFLIKINHHCLSFRLAG